MGAGTLALAGLLWATAVLPPDMIAMKDRAIQIPINFNKERRHEIHDLFLFVSTDQGLSWNQEGRAAPDKQFFPFYAQNDGVYWFAVMIVDHNGRKDPPDLRQMPPGLKVLIDTQPPVVQLRTAERVGDDVTVSWAIQEQNPVETSFRLEYRAAKDPAAQWTPVQVTPAPSGTQTFRVNVAGAIAVRLSLQDCAQNTGQAMKTVGEDTGAMVAAYPPPAPVTPVPITPVSPGPSPSVGIVPLQPEPPAPAPRLDPPAPDRAATNPIARSGSDGFTAAASQPVQPASGTYGTPAAPPRPELRDTQLINSKQVTFDYTVKQHGPSGVRRAILYVTNDDGQTWQEAANDVPGVNMKVTANLPSEGIYGFFLVLESGAGLRIDPPTSGTQPQMRVEVDVTAPVVELYQPAPDPNNRDTLILRWSATDKNLSNNRILLEYADAENGPWVKIAEAPNTGQFPWKLPPKMPYRVYLKVTARDLAGNEGVARTPSPQMIDLNKPVGGLTGISKTTIQLHP